MGILCCFLTGSMTKEFIPPGGKVDFPESFVEAAIREVKEETGLDVSNLQFKILYEYVNPKKNDRYIIFNYITKDFKGTLLEDPTEGKPVWVPISETSNLPMQKSIRRSFPYFFEEGTYEIQVVWDDDKNEEASISIKRT
ncbi:phosphohydrolase (MutT/nudix family protein) [Bacillus sp. B-jedd]|nr:phosphohydrolase (MutT/nudix family protein) [Bacillus sp. B-jedd]